eukprot:TRINITY_DN70749_c0_g1_i1.p1 TRINITY_DN70749_c0_g1~~TRINITY_DN70749_c0_g1_i1.p1  ORF type:complete len:292 (+),score=27.42 TRINITY_DN70749_c0_g1_i1:2803-3678(+)
MPRPVALLATIVIGTAARFLIPRLPLLWKRRNQKALEASQLQDETDEEDVTQSEQDSVTDLSVPSSQASWSHAHRTPSQPKPVLCAADVLSLLDAIAPRSNYSHQVSVQCTFCLEDVKTGQRTRSTPCRHTFHAHCLEQWALHATTKLMNTGMYSVRRDGIVCCAARFPSCPNCSALLDVVPRPVWTFVLLSAVTSSLSLRDNRHAADMYRSGMVVRDDVLNSIHLRIPLDQNRKPSDWIETIDDDDESSTSSQYGRLHSTGMTPLSTTPARTRAEQRGFGRADTRLAYAS